MTIQKPYIYLAGPYTSTSDLIRTWRGTMHCKIAAELYRQGILVYSPIAETMSMAEYGNMSNTSWETWREKDLRQLSKHDEMWIMDLPEWEKSRGVKGEIKYCMHHNIPIKLLPIPTKKQPLKATNVTYDQLLKLLGFEVVEDLND